MNLKNYIRDIQGFPKKEIVFEAKGVVILED